MLRKPYFKLRPDQQRERLALARRVVRAILQDPEVSFRCDATGVVSLVGGSMDNAGEVLVAAADVNGNAIDVARAMQLSMRQTLRFPRRRTRDELYEARCAITLYDAVAVSVRGHGGKKRAAAAVSLADLVGEQVRRTQEQGVFTPPRGTNEIPMLVCTDATPLWGPLPPAAMCLLGFGLVAQPVRGTQTIGERGGSWMEMTTVVLYVQWMLRHGSTPKLNICSRTAMCPWRTARFWGMRWA